MATIKQVAKMAQVSVGTVSNVINGLPVNENMRQRVNMAIEKLQYKPNLAARMLKTNRSYSISLILPDITNPFYPELARGVGDIVKERDFSLVLCNSERSKDEEMQYIDLMIQQKMDGVIIVKPHINRDEIVKMQKSCAVVVVDAEEDRMEGVNLVNSDDYNGQMEAIKHLYHLGHRDMGFIAGQLQAKSDLDRLRAFKDAHTVMDMDLQERNIVCGVYSHEYGYEGALQLLKRRDKPTAILCSNDLLAFGALRAAHDIGLHVPGDVSIMGYDDIAAAKVCTPQLSTVNRPKYEIGRQSALMLFEAIDRKDEELNAKHLLLPAHLVIRSSTQYINNKH